MRTAFHARRPRRCAWGHGCRIHRGDLVTRIGHRDYVHASHIPEALTAVAAAAEAIPAVLDQMAATMIAIAEALGPYVRQMTQETR